MANKFQELRKKISNIPGKDGWWKSSSEETFFTLGEKLIKKGFSVKEAIDFLEAAYSVVSIEYGS